MPKARPSTTVTAAAPQSGQRTRERAAFIDPAALMRINDLQLRARIVVEGFFNGLHKSPYHGFSVEFSEYRQYTAGDELRTADQGAPSLKPRAPVALIHSLDLLLPPALAPEEAVLAEDAPGGGDLVPALLRAWGRL